MRALIVAFALVCSAWAEPVKWSISVGTLGEATEPVHSLVIQSSGDILTEEVAPGQQPSREVTGYVNREELDILGRMLADPQLQKAQVSKSAAQTRFLTFTYGELKRTFKVGSETSFPEPVGRLSREVERALSAAKQD